MGLELFGLRLAVYTGDVGVEIGPKAAGGARALERPGGMKNGEPGEVLGETFLRLVPSLADVDVVGVVVNFDNIEAITPAVGDELGAGNEIVAKFKIVPVARYVIIEDVVAVETLRYDAVGRFVDIIDKYSPALLLGGS